VGAIRSYRKGTANRQSEWSIWRRFEKGKEEVIKTGPTLIKRDGRGYFLDFE